MNEEEVVLFSTPTCPHCEAARAYLRERGIAFTEYDVAADVAALRRLLWLTGRAWVPAISVRGDMLVGFDSERLAVMLGETTLEEEPLAET